jgi:hypothetical protein
MEQLLNVLALDHPDWTIPWAGLGAALLGLGSALSGLAAIMTARRTTQAKEREDEKQQHDNNVSHSGVNDGGGERISDSDSTESGSSGSD